MYGNVVRDLNSGVLLFDETVYQECGGGESGCYWISVNVESPDYNGKNFMPDFFLFSSRYVISVSIAFYEPFLHFTHFGIFKPNLQRLEYSYLL